MAFKKPERSTGSQFRKVLSQLIDETTMPTVTKPTFKTVPTKTAPVLQKAPVRNTAPTRQAPPAPPARVAPKVMRVAPQPAEDTQNEQETYILRDVEIHWPKLDPQRPSEAFGDFTWDVQVQFGEDRLEEIQQLGKVRELSEGVYATNFKKKAFKKDGTSARPISVVDTHRNPIDPNRIGNGSIANIKLLLRPYEIKDPKGRVTKHGVAKTLQKIQITNYIPYEPVDDDFDYEDAEEQVDEGYTDGEYAEGDVQGPQYR